MLPLALLLASASATELTHTGRLLDSAGEPIDGTVQITVALSSDEAGSSELYRETFTGVDVDGGFFAVVLGPQDDDGDALSPAWFRSDLYLHTEVDGVLLGGASRVTGLPGGGGAAGVRASCQAWLDDGFADSGTYDIDVDGSGPLPAFRVFCDQQTDGGGWMRFELVNRFWGNTDGYSTDPSLDAGVGTRSVGSPGSSQQALDNLTGCSGDTQVPLAWRTADGELARAQLAGVNALVTEGFTSPYYVFDGDGGADWDQVKGCYAGSVVLTGDGSEFAGTPDSTWGGPFAVDSLTGLPDTGFYGGQSNASGYNLSLPRHWYVR